VDPIQILGYFGAFLVGLILGLIGSGGSILSMPILVYIFQVPVVLATGYSLFIVGITSLIGSIKNLKDNLINYDTTLFFSISAIISVYVTQKYILGNISDIIYSSDFMILTKEDMIMLIFSILMLVAGFFMIKKSPKTIVKIKNIKTIAPNKLIVLAEGTLTGFITGLVGAGGGFIIVPILVILAKLRMKHAIATSLAIISLKSLIGFIGAVEFRGDEFDWNLLLSFTILAIIGIFVGQHFNDKVASDKLKDIFGIFVISIAIIILIKTII
jgi:hypothetical protein